MTPSTHAEAVEERHLAGSRGRQWTSFMAVADVALPLFRTLWCVSMTPFGKPVVPEVYCIMTTLLLSKWASASASASSGTCCPRSTSSGTL